MEVMFCQPVLKGLRSLDKDRPRIFSVEEGDSCVLSKNRG